MKRIVILLLFVLLLVGGLAIVSKSIDSAGSFAVISNSDFTSIPVPTEKWSDTRWESAGYYKNTFEEWVPRKDLDSYYKNRAYYGAPPFIPHDIEDELSMGGDDCLKCHANGGYVNKWDAFAPVVPHPEKVNCRQCHATVNTENLFKNTEWEKDKRKPVTIHNTALMGSPPVIPHSLEMRENCLSCHSGPSAPAEIRVTHPERVNCRQCHALNDQAEEIKDFVKELK